MDFLGHIYFSNNNIELMYSNLFGDFVKGNNFSKYTVDIQEGITLHRHIDNYIDRHPVVLELARFLYPKLPKVSGIAVDIYFDHLLAKNWRQFHTIELDDFLNEFESYPISLDKFNNPEFATPEAAKLASMFEFVFSSIDVSCAQAQTIVMLGRG